MNILEISNLNKKYKDFELKNINLIIPAGFIFGFVGQNGAGTNGIFAYMALMISTHIVKTKDYR